MFAKLFNDTEFGQILVVLNTCDEGNPQIVFSFQPEDLGVCNMSMNAKNDSEKAFDSFDKFFEEMDEETAVNAVREVQSQFLS